jgi:hypothetical protein
VNAWQRLSLAALALGLVVACSSSAATPGPVSPGGGATGGAVQGTPSSGGSGGGRVAPPLASKPGKPLLDPAGQACAQPSCAYHAGAGGYFFCLAGGAGACFHFGSPCEPAEACMLE